jgi:hypothetical protein
MNRTLLGVTTFAVFAAAASGSISIDKLTERQHRQALARQAKDQAALPPQSASPAPTPTADAANNPTGNRPVPAGPVREASAAGPWSPSSALPSSRDVDSLLPADDTYTTHGTGTRPPPPLGRTWDPNRETYNEWYARVIQGTNADPATYPTSGGPNSGNSSTDNGGTNQYGEWAYSDNVHVVGRVFLPDGTTPGVGFVVYIVPAFVNPPFAFPMTVTYTDSQGYFYADLWASGVWGVAVTRDTPQSESRTVYTAWTFDRMYSGDEPNTLILQSRLGGSWR